MGPSHKGFHYEEDEELEEEEAAVSGEELELELEGEEGGPSMRRELSVEDLFAPLNRLDVTQISSLSAQQRRARSRGGSSDHAQMQKKYSPQETIARSSVLSVSAPSNLSVSNIMASIPEESGLGLGLGISERFNDHGVKGQDQIHTAAAERNQIHTQADRDRFHIWSDPLVAAAPGDDEPFRSQPDEDSMSRFLLDAKGIQSPEVLQNSTSDDERHTGNFDDRKQRRMLSNRESARRSRLRKQQHLDELRGHVAQLRSENGQMLTRFNLASQHLTHISEENRQLRSEAMNLSHQLQRLHHIVVSHRNSSNNIFQVGSNSNNKLGASGN